MDAFEIGARMRAARLRKKLQLSDIARGLSTSEATISRYERGMHEPKPSDLVRIARLLAVPVGYLLGESELVLGETAEERLAQALALAEPGAIGSRIRSARESAGLSQAIVAERCGVSPSLVSRWERGDRLPDGEMAISLCRALGADICEVWQGIAGSTAQPETVMESLMLLQAALSGTGEIANITKGGLRRILSLVAQGGGVGWDDPVRWWLDELRKTDVLSEVGNASHGR